MREILFRGKTTPKEIGEFNNTWVYGDLIKSKDKYYIHPQSNAVTVDNELGRIIVMHEVITESIGQYTGLKDRDGKRIFEGDIVEDLTTIRVVHDLVDFKNGGYYPYSIETIIIGNIHDNPELVMKGEIK